MKSFDEFLSTITRQDMEQITQETISTLKASDTTFTEQEMKLAMVISQSSAMCFKSLLERYHNWLSEQID